MLGGGAIEMLERGNRLLNVKNVENVENKQKNISNMVK